LDALSLKYVEDCINEVRLNKSFRFEVFNKAINTC